MTFYQRNTGSCSWIGLPYFVARHPGICTAAHGTEQVETGRIPGNIMAVRTGDYDRSVLYVETTGAPQLSFEIKNFIVDAPNGIPKPKPAFYGVLEAVQP